MKNKLDIIMKWLSLVFLGVSIVLSTYMFNDYRLRMQVGRTNDIAMNLAALNNKLTNDAISEQINAVLARNGYTNLLKPIKPQEDDNAERGSDTNLEEQNDNQD